MEPMELAAPHGRNKVPRNPSWLFFEYDPLADLVQRYLSSSLSSWVKQSISVQLLLHGGATGDGKGHRHLWGYMKGGSCCSAMLAYKFFEGLLVQS